MTVATDAGFILTQRPHFNNLDKWQLNNVTPLSLAFKKKKIVKTTFVHRSMKNY